MPASSYRGRPLSREEVRYATSRSPLTADGLANARPACVRPPRAGHGGRGTSLRVTTRVSLAPEPAAHTRRGHTRRCEESGAAPLQEPAAHTMGAPGTIARGTAPTTSGAVKSSRIRGALQAPGPGQDQTGALPGVRYALIIEVHRRHSPTRGGGRAMPPGRTMVQEWATRPRNQEPRPHGAARRKGGLGHAPKPHQPMVDMDPAFLPSHDLVPFKRVQAQLRAISFSNYRRSLGAGRRPGHGGDGPDLSQEADFPRTTQSWFTRRRRSL